MPLVRHEIERRDLRRRGTLSTRYGQAVFNLPTPRAGRVEILARVPAISGGPLRPHSMSAPVTTTT